MGCPKNPKSFWSFKWNGDHDWKHLTIRVWGNSSWAKYEVTSTCSKCSVYQGRTILTERELQALGYDVEKLQKLDIYLGLSEPAKDLKA